MKKMTKSKKVPQKLGRFKTIVVCGNFKFTQIQNEPTPQSNYRNKLKQLFVQKSVKNFVRVYSTLLRRKCFESAKKKCNICQKLSTPSAPSFLACSIL